MNGVATAEQTGLEAHRGESSFAGHTEQTENSMASLAVTHKNKSTGALVRGRVAALTEHATAPETPRDALQREAIDIVNSNGESITAWTVGTELLRRHPHLPAHGVRRVALVLREAARYTCYPFALIGGKFLYPFGSEDCSGCAACERFSPNSRRPKPKAWVPYHDDCYCDRHYESPDTDFTAYFDRNCKLHRLTDSEVAKALVDIVARYPHGIGAPEMVRELGRRYPLFPRAGIRLALSPYVNRAVTSVTGEIDWTERTVFVPSPTGPCADDEAVRPRSSRSPKLRGPR